MEYLGNARTSIQIGLGFSLQFIFTLEHKYTHKTQKYIIWNVHTPDDIFSYFYGFHSIRNELANSTTNKSVAKHNSKALTREFVYHK